MRRIWATPILTACGAGMLMLIASTASRAAQSTNTTSVDRPDVGAARASYDINRNAGQTTFLDRQISGLGFAPTAFSSTKVQRGMGLDIYYTLVAGSLFGSRRGVGDEFADPILSQLAAVQGKWILLREGPLWPSAAAGVDLNLDLNFRGGLPFSKFKTLTYPSFIAFSKTIYRRTGTFLTIGRYSAAQMEHLAYLTRFLDPESTGVMFAGLDFKVKDPSKGFRVEYFIPKGHIDNAKIANFYIKAMSAMPMTLFTYAHSDAGRALAMSVSFRISLFPSLTKPEKYKRRWWNPLSWYQDDNKNMATKLALQSDAFMKTGKYKLAVQKYQESIFLNDKVPEVHYNKAMAHLQLGTPDDLARSVFHFNRSIELGGPDAGKLYALGLAYFKAGQKDIARLVWTDALKFEPEYIGAIQGLKLLDNLKG